MTTQILVGDALDVLRTLDAGSVQCCVTSPPYWGLRDYGTATWHGGDAECDHNQARRGLARARQETSAGTSRDSLAGFVECRWCGASRVDRQLGLERTPEEYVAKLVAVFGEVRRVLADDGTLWLNLGDSYNAYNGNRGRSTSFQSATEEALPRTAAGFGLAVKTLGNKQLLGIPWRVAFALQANGWYLRSDIIWSKPNPMPESVTDRPTKAHEYLFLLAKSERYYYDADAIKEPALWGSPNSPESIKSPHGQGFTRRNNPEWQKQRAATNAEKGAGNRNAADGGFTDWQPEDGRNKRTVWTVSTTPYSGAHFATFPPALIEPCILAGTSPQACESCGAPWERVVEGSKYEPPEGDRFVDESRGDKRRKLSGAAYNAATSDRRTTGWKPTCACEHNTGSARCTVLDPFGGAGTTGLVADRLNRNALLIELNPEYAELARRRIEGDAGMFADVAVGVSGTPDQRDDR